MDNVLDVEAIERELRLVAEHWEQLEAEVGHPCLLEDAYGRADFNDDRVLLHTKNEALVVQINDESVAVHQVEAVRDSLRTRFDQFKNAMQARLSKSPYFRELPTKPQATCGEAALLKPIGDIADVWRRINADTTLPTTVRPFTIAGGYTHEQLVAERAQAAEAFQTASTAKSASKMTRKERDDVAKRLQKRRRQYRSLAQAELPKDHPLLRTLPK